MDRLKAIADGQHVDSLVHDEVLQADPVLRIVNFNLFYGRKQALADRARRLSRRASVGERDHSQGSVARGALRRDAAARHREGA